MISAVYKSSHGPVNLISIISNVENCLKLFSNDSHVEFILPSMLSFLPVIILTLVIAWQ